MSILDALKAQPSSDDSVRSQPLLLYFQEGEKISLFLPLEYAIFKTQIVIPSEEDEKYKMEILRFHHAVELLENPERELPVKLNINVEQESLNSEDDSKEED